MKKIAIMLESTRAYARAVVEGVRHIDDCPCP
jgi:hypothetical protein